MAEQQARKRQSYIKPGVKFPIWVLGTRRDIGHIPEAIWLGIGMIWCSGSAFLRAVLASVVLSQVPAIAATAAAPRYPGPHIDVLTYHYDTLRTGWNQNETQLTPANVNTHRFGVVKKLQVDGLVLAQPLLVSNFVMPDGTTHDVLIIATMHNSVYAFDAQTFSLLWQVSLGPSQTSTATTQSNIPEYGVGSTPVIVRGGPDAATIYLVAATQPTPTTYLTQLHAIDAGTGLDLLPPATIAPKAVINKSFTLAYDPTKQWNRAGLAYNNGSIYIGFGSHGDAGKNDTTGWLLNYSTKLTLIHAFHTTELASGLELASIWMSGFAPAIDETGNVFFVTGNGEVTVRGYNAYGESAVSLSPSLATVNSSFTPHNWAALNQFDTDFGSGGIMLLPVQAGQAAPPMAVAAGKNGTMYLLNRSRLGGLTPTDSGALQITHLPGTNGLWGGPAFYSGPAGSFVYIQAQGAPVSAYALSAANPPSLTLAVQGTTKAGNGGSIPIISSDGATAGTAVLWLIRHTAPLRLEAYNAETLGAPIYSGGAGSWLPGDMPNAYITAMEANGHVFVAANQTVIVFGLF
jgi:hypothetical protein